MRAVIFGVLHLSSTKLSGKHYISYLTNGESVSDIYIFDS